MKVTSAGRVRARGWAAGAVALAACGVGGCASSPGEGGGARSGHVEVALAAPVVVPSATAGPSSSPGGAAPEGLVETEPQDPADPSGPRERIVVGEREVVVTVAAPVGDDAPAAIDVAVSRAGVELGRLTSSGGDSGCAEVRVALEAARGDASPLVVAQVFCENGEDEFSRGIGFAVVHVGSDTTEPHVVWEGHGTYRNSFGRCEQLDVPAARVEGDRLIVERTAGVIAHPNPQRLGGPCAARALVKREVARLLY